MKRSYKPSGSSLLFSFLWDISPAAVALVGYLFAHELASDRGLGWLIVIGTVVMCLLSLLLILQTIAVHLRWVTIDERSIAVTGPFGMTTIAFSSIAGAVLRERVNTVSRTDHLLIIRSYAGELLIFNPSTLSREDEDDFLEELRRRVHLEVIRDGPTL